MTYYSLLAKFVLISSYFMMGFASHVQCSKDYEKYQHDTLFLDQDTIHYHTYHTSPLDSINTILLYVQGSGPRPLFQIKHEIKGFRVSSAVPFDLRKIPSNYLFVVISKKGLPFCTALDGNFKTPAIYYEHETLAYRALQADHVIKHLAKTHPQVEKIIALGHSEGSDVIAKLGTISEEVTHFGFWAGSGNSQLYDFPLFVRQQVNRGEITEEEALVQMDSLLAKYKDIVANRDHKKKQWLNNSYKRWYYFAEPPVENLVQIDQPIFVAMGTADQSVPIESVYLIPVEFIRKEKDNLTFKIYPHLDHSFRKQTADGKKEDHWNDVFLDFLNWIEQQS